MSSWEIESYLLGDADESSLLSSEVNPIHYISGPIHFVSVKNHGRAVTWESKNQLVTAALWGLASSW